MMRSRGHTPSGGPATATPRRDLRVALALWMMLAMSGCQAPKREALTPETPPPAVLEPTPESIPAAPPPPEPTEKPAPPPPDVFERLRARLGSDHCEEGARQAQWIRLYAPRPDRFGARIAPMLPLFDYVLSQIEAADLPGEFALIPIIESSYRPQARSPAGPAGMWQFTADTARHFGLRVSGERDERLSVVDATEAALEHLAQLQSQHGDWALAAAGYNAGAFRLSKLLERLDQPPPPGQLPQGLARGTYEYVEKLKAWACMLSEPERFGIRLPDPDGFEPLTRVTAPPRLQRLDLLSEASGVNAELLRSLNPLLRPAAPARGDKDLLLPENAAAGLLAFMERVKSGEVSVPEPRAHTVVAGDTLSAIARRHGLSLADLLQWNGLNAKSVLRIGQVLRLAPGSAAAGAGAR